MKKARQLQEHIAELNARGIQLWVEKDKLHFKAPKGVMSAQDMEWLKANKPALMEYYAQACVNEQVESHPEIRYEPFALTDIQSAYLLGRFDSMQYGGTACHIYMELLYDDLEPERTIQVWNEIIRRHDMLHAVVFSDGKQQVLQDIPMFTLPVHDMRGAPEDRCMEHMEQVRSKMGHSIYTIGEWPMFGLALTRTNHQSILHFSMEFLIADWASIWQIQWEFELLYFNPEMSLPLPTIQFCDYLVAEKTLRNGPAYILDRNYWLDRIDRLPGAPELPILPNKENVKAHFTRRQLALDASEWASFKNQAQARGLTPTVAILSVYAAVIEKWSHSKHFCLNLTVLNRLPLHKDVNSIVGDFTSVSLLEVNAKPGMSFQQFGSALGQQLFDDLDHRLFSGIEVLRELNKRRGRDSSLMPVVFTSAIGMAENNGKGQLVAKYGSYGISQTPQVFIDCQVMDGAFGFQANWDIRDGVFPETVADDMFSAFSAAVHKLVQSKESWGANHLIELPPHQVSRRLLYEDTAHPLPTHLLHADVLAQCRRNPETTAVAYGDEELTFRDLGLRATCVCRALLSDGLLPGSNVGVLVPKSTWQPACVLGILMAGGVYVPIDPEQGTKRQQVIVERAQLQAVVALSNQDTDAISGIPRIYVDQLPEALDIDAGVDVPLSQLAYIIHTSGTTGVPKGVAITHEAAVNTIEDINERFGVTDHDRVLALSKLNFDLSVYDLFGVLGAGGTVVYPLANRYTDAAHWVELMMKYKITMWNTVPALMQLLVYYLSSGSRVIKLPDVRLALLSGDWIPLHLPEEIQKYMPGADIISLGGATEASIWSIYHRCGSEVGDWSSIPYGKPLYNQTFKVLDLNLCECPDFVQGQLAIGGLGLAQGYFGDTQFTKEKFIQHPETGERLYLTGDNGRFRENNEIEFLGRSDGQVKLHGHRIELGEIDAALLKSGLVRQAISLIHGKSQEMRLYAMIVPVSAALSDRDAAGTFVHELTNHLNEYVPAYMVPANMFFIDEIPLNSNGKVDRNQLAALLDSFLDQVKPASLDARTSSKLEKELQDLWSEVLEEQHISLDQDLYDAGADSLAMGKMATKLQGIYSCGIAYDEILVQMLNEPTIKALACFIEQKQSTHGKGA